jgi:uroporphyrinogen decarboxylase
MPTESTKPLLRVLGGDAVWPPPVWLMRQAGRYLPEYRSIRAQAGDFIKLCTTPELAAEVTLQPVRRFGFDGAILFSDILLVPWALGYGLEYREGEGPVLPCLRGATDLAGLDCRRLRGALSPVMETVRQVRAALAADHPDTTLIGFAGGPFTVACYMIEGGGSKDFHAVRMLAYRDPLLFGELIRIITESTVDYLSDQVEAGAEALMLFDSWAGILPPTLFRKYVVEPTSEIIARLKGRWASVPVIGFPRMAGLMVAEYVAATGVDGIGVDTAVELALAATMIPLRVALQGNLDPLALVEGGSAMRRDVQSILAAMHGRPFVFNLGHGVVPQTPPENVAELVRLVRAG